MTVVQIRRLVRKKMRRIAQAVMTTAGALLLALSVTTSASASSTITAYAAPDTSETPNAAHGGKATFQPDGEHLYVTDLAKDGHSAIGLISIGCDTSACDYYYWNRNGVDTTRDVNLDLPEGTHIGLKACIGDWSGTPTGGIRFGSCSSLWEETTA